MCGVGVAGARWREHEVKQRGGSTKNEARRRRGEEARLTLLHTTPQMPLFFSLFPCNVDMHNTRTLVSLLP